MSDSLIHFFDSDGGFVVGCTDSTSTWYSYPSSPYAKRARLNPDEVALEVAGPPHTRGGYRGDPSIVADYDSRNWDRLRKAGRL